MSERLFVGVDVGTTHMKAAAVSASGEVKAGARSRTPTRRDGWGEVHRAADIAARADRLVSEVVAAVPGGRLAGLCAASVAEEGWFLDRAGRVLAPSPLWSERRQSPSQEAWRERHDLVRAYKRTGVDSDAIRTLMRWLWQRDHAPRVLDRAARWLSVSEYLAWRWSGEAAVSATQASRTHLWSIADGRWCEDWMAELGLDPSLMPPIAAPGSLLGSALPDAVPHVPRDEHVVVAVGGHDHVVGGWAAGVEVPGQVLLSLGTAESVWTVLPKARPDETALRHGVEFGAAVAAGSRYAMLAQAAGQNLAAWAAICGMPVERFIATAEGAEPGAGGVRYDPPPWRQDGRGTLQGLAPAPTVPTLARAVLEGWALGSALAFRELERLAGRPLDSVRAIGGGSAASLWLRIRASMLGRPIDVIDVPEAVATGAAHLARGGALGHVETSPLRVSARFEPEPAWQGVYASWVEAAGAGG